MRGGVNPSFVLCWSLVLAWCLNGAAGLLYLQDSQNGTIQIFSDQPADFSPPVNDVVYGMLVITQPLDACTPIAQPNYTNGSPWVALISRSNPNNTCHFAVKVQHAKDAGAIAAIIDDTIYEGLVVMSRTETDPNPNITAVFVSMMTGMFIRTTFQPGGYFVSIAPDVSVDWAIMGLSIVAGILAVTIVSFLLYLLRRRRGRDANGQGRPSAAVTTVPVAPRGLSAEELEELPILVHGETSELDSDNMAKAVENGEKMETIAGVQYEGGDTIRCCAICLEQYKQGDKLRLLPCGHRYHCSCVDTWLTQRRPSCPLCKYQLGKPIVVEADAEPPPPDAVAENGTRITSDTETTQNPVEESRPNSNSGFVRRLISVDRWIWRRQTPPEPTSVQMQDMAARPQGEV